VRLQHQIDQEKAPSDALAAAVRDIVLARLGRLAVQPELRPFACPRQTHNPIRARIQYGFQSHGTKPARIHHQARDLAAWRSA
jgi:hypothetical protein